MKKLETRIPPPLLVLLYGIAMWLAARYLPAASLAEGWFTSLWRYWSTVLLIIATGGLFAFALVAFKRKKTTVNPHHPGKTSALITSGVFRISRNPLYLAMYFILLAWGVWLGNGLAVLLSTGFIPTINRLQIIPEEKALQAIFGEEFEQYRQRVRRWL